MNEISKSLKCIIMRNGVEIWKEQERIDNLRSMLISGKKVGFIDVDGEMINSVDIVGIFNPETMGDTIRRKSGQWKCFKGVWHEKNEKCSCLTNEQEKIKKEYQEDFYKKNGYYP